MSFCACECVYVGRNIKIIPGLTVLEWEREQECPDSTMVEKTEHSVYLMIEKYKFIIHARKMRLKVKSPSYLIQPQIKLWLKLKATCFIEQLMNDLKKKKDC